MLRLSDSMAVFTQDNHWNGHLFNASENGRAGGPHLLNADTKSRGCATSRAFREVAITEFAPEAGVQTKSQGARHRNGPFSKPARRGAPRLSLCPLTGLHSSLHLA